MAVEGILSRRASQETRMLLTPLEPNPVPKSYIQRISNVMYCSTYPLLSRSKKKITTNVLER